MIIRSRKLLIAALISGAIFAILLFSARFTLPDLSRANPAWLGALGAAFVVQLTLRGNLLCAFAEPAQRGQKWRWVRLAARHQATFSILPMGIGDAGFPYYANRIADVPTLAAVRLLLQLRMRDAVVILSMAAIGLATFHISPQAGYLIAAVSFPCLWFADRLAATTVRMLAGIIPHGRFAMLMREIADIHPATPKDRALHTLMSLGIWSCSVIAVLSASRAVGVHMSLAQVVLFIAAVNLAGLMKLSIAGLGVAEAGATAALVVTGVTLERAASLALLVRPMILLMLLVACLLTDLLLGFWSAGRKA